MEIFRLSHRHRFLKVWLMAIACQTTPLFSQIEQAYEKPHASSGAVWNHNYYLHPTQDSHIISYDPFPGSSYQNNHWQMPQGMRPDQVNMLIDPDHASGYYRTPQPDDQVSSNLPPNGQWPATSTNEWHSSVPSQPPTQMSYEPNNVPYSSDIPPNEQWPAISTNEWQNQEIPFNEQSASYSPIEPSAYSFETPPYPLPSDPSSFPDSTPTDKPPSQLMSWIEPSQTPQPAADFAPFPPPATADADKQNFITFDPDLAEAPDKEQHPLSQEGQATTYHFENGALGAPASHPTEIHHLQKNQDLPKTEKKDLLQKEEMTPNLSEGKGNIKIIKKRSEPISSSRRLEEALQQPEVVIGKQIISEPVVGLKEEGEGKEIASEEANREELKHLQEQLVSSNKENSSIDSKSDEGSAKEEIAQALPPRGAPTAPRAPTIVTPTAPPAGQNPALKEISINFNNVAMIEYIRFISRISNKNFIFDDEDLQFNVTIVSEEPTTVENLMAALLQELKIRDLSLIEQGNNIIIHRNARIRSPARIVADGLAPTSAQESEIVTRVFRLNTLDPVKASEIIRPLLSEDALIEVLRDTNNLIVTDLVTNVNKIAQLIGTLDAPNSGITIGQYVVRNAFVDSLVDLTNKILQPIAQGNPFVLVPHPVSNSIFIVSNSFIVEKALAILQNLDLNEGRTKILSLETLQPSYASQAGGGAAGPGGAIEPGGGAAGATRLHTEAYPFGPGGAGTPGAVPGLIGPGGIGLGGGPAGFGPGGAAAGFGPGGAAAAGIGPGGVPIGGGFGPGGQFATPEGVPESFPLGGIGAEGRGTAPLPLIPPPGAFGPGGIGAEGRQSAIFEEGRDFLPGGIGAASRWSRDLPIGHIERTLFFIYKLRYRKGDNIEIALRKIANSLHLAGTANVDLISAINSSQWIESSNALLFTGTARALEKVRELILEIDVPLRQVFIEMLILDTTIVDSLTYGVDWINRFGGGTTTGEEGFLANTPGGADSSLNNFVLDSQTILPTPPGVPCNATSTTPSAQACPLPTATGLLNSAGFVAGVIGTHLTHNGTHFSTIGALVRAIHTDAKTNILLNPKIITEDNNPAEIFVGGTDRYKTQSITNDLGSLVTNNFQFIDVGTTLRVTPLIGNNGIITLEIVQETTNDAPGANNPALANSQAVNLVQVLTKARTVTKVHVPNGFFVVLSGMIQDTESRSYSQIPCLGGIPILGAVGKRQDNADNKRNLMLFIRPLIIDTDDDYEDITRRQQDVYREKSKFRRSWNYEIDEGLNFLNVKPTDPDEIGCAGGFER